MPFRRFAEAPLILLGLSARLKRLRKKARIGWEGQKTFPPGLKCLRENRDLEAQKRNQVYRAKAGFIQNQQVSAAWRPSESASQPRSGVLTQTLKPRVDFAGFVRGLKPPPPSGSSFSAACEAVP